VADRKKLLFLSAFYPLPVTSGTQARALHWIQRLSRRFDVTLLSILHGRGVPAELETLSSCCSRTILVVPDNKRSPVHRGAFKALYWFRRVTTGESADRFYTMIPSVRRALRCELGERRYDVLFFSYWFWSPWVYEAPGFKVIDANDVQWERYAYELQNTRNPIDRLLRAQLLERYRRREVEALRRSDVVVSPTPRDRDILSAQTNGNTAHLVVPTGVDTDHFAPSRVAWDPGSVVFYGSLRNPMNVDALTYLVEDILPRIRKQVPGAHLTVVGASPSEKMLRRAASDRGITFTGYLDDVREPLARAGVALLPLRFGHGVRGRVYELLAMGVPVVASPVAVAGMDLESGDGLLFADSPDAFADAVARVLGDPELRARLVERGRQLAVSQVSLAATYDRLVEFLDRHVSTAPAERVP
jgi:glycosyltransferase involved in cell wall biosynthesis